MVRVHGREKAWSGKVLIVDFGLLIDNEAVG